MIVRSGLAHSIHILFDSGHPEGPVSWRLLGSTGVMLASGSVAVPAEAVSLSLTIASEYNTLTPGSLISSRDLEWSYSVAGSQLNGEVRYSVEARPPYGASNDGVRAKLGVAVQDLPDSDISLIRSYINFRDLVGADELSTVADEARQVAIADAIEAQAALNLIPTMAVRIAASEDSGTNAFKRQTVDWGAVAEALSGIINSGVLAVLPNYDPMASAGALFILATPSTDPFTGSGYA